MANADRPIGFWPVRGRWNNSGFDISLADVCLVDDEHFDAESSAIAVGCAVAATNEAPAGTITGQLDHLRRVVPLTDEHDESTDLVWGVVVGISKIAEDNTTFNNAFGQGMYNPGDLTNLGSNVVLTAEVEADVDGVLIHVARASDWIFAGQTNAAITALAPGYIGSVSSIDDGADEIYDSTTGRCIQEVKAVAGNGQLVIDNVPRGDTNDAEAANALVHFHFLIDEADGTAVGVDNPDG